MGSSGWPATNASGLGSLAGSRLSPRGTDRRCAFVGPGDTLGRVEVWATTGRAEWEQVATLPGGDRFTVYRAAGGPRGWVALGATDAATLLRGLAFRGWSASGSKAATGPDVWTSVIGVDAGFVAAGRDRSLGRRDLRGPARLSRAYLDLGGRPHVAAHGRQQGLRVGVRLGHSLVVGRNLVGIGGSYPGPEHFYDAFVPTRWTAPLPIDQPRRRAPSDRPSKPQTCGG